MRLTTWRADLITESTPIAVHWMHWFQQVAGTFVSAPLTFVSARMMSLARANPADYIELLDRFLLHVAIVGLVCTVRSAVKRPALELVFIAPDIRADDPMDRSSSWWSSSWRERSGGRCRTSRRRAWPYRKWWPAPASSCGTRSVATSRGRSTFSSSSSWWACSVRASGRPCSPWRCCSCAANRWPLSWTRDRPSSSSAGG